MTQDNKNDSKIYRYLDSDLGIRAAFLNATAAVQEMQAIQTTFPIPTMLVGRSMVAACLLSAQMDEGEMVSLYFRGDGPIETVFAEGQYDGKVRGYTSQPSLNLPLRQDGRLDIGAAVGKGTLTVVRTHPKRNTPFRGTVEIQTGEVGDEIAHYLHQSEQRRSLVVLGVKLDTHGKAVAAGGILVELLPGAPEAAAILIEENARHVNSISTLIEQGHSADEIVQMYLHDFNMRQVEHPFSVLYACRCSKDRLVNSLKLFKRDELDEMIAKKEVLKAKCEFCGREYAVDWAEVKSLRDEKFRSNLH